MKPTNHSFSNTLSQINMTTSQINMTTAAMRFSGGKDSMLAALRLGPRCKNLDLLTFSTRMIADADTSRVNATHLIEMLAPTTRVSHDIIDIDGTVRYLYQPRGWWDNWRRYGSHACCCMCNACDLAMIVHTVMHCARYGIALAFDGASHTEFAGFMDDWGLPKIHEFAGIYGVRWEFPVYDEEDVGLSILEAGLEADVPRLLFGSQPYCKGGGHATNLYMRCYYLPRYGAESYRRTTLRWLDDRLELARRFVDEHLQTQSARP